MLARRLNHLAFLLGCASKDPLAMSALALVASLLTLAVAIVALVLPC